MILILILFYCSAPVFALPQDSRAKIHIIADVSHYNYKTGMSLFEGHVKIDQGTTHITADRLITKNNMQHQIQEVIAYGAKEQAHYWTLPKEGEKEIHAKANIIKFYPIASNIALEKNVTLIQGENSFQGQLILYNNNNQTIIVPESNHNRSVLVYNPEN